MRCSVRGGLLRLVFALVMVVGCLTGCGGDDGALDAERCQRVREHRVDLSLGSEDMSPYRADRRQIIRRALGQEFLSQCVREMREEHVECLLSANDAKAVAGCSSQFTR